MFGKKVLIFSVLLLSLFTVGCGSKKEEEIILKGTSNYWKLVKIITFDGMEKEYTGVSSEYLAFEGKELTTYSLFDGKVVGVNPQYYEIENGYIYLKSDEFNKETKYEEQIKNTGDKKTYIADDTKLKIILEYPNGGKTISSYENISKKALEKIVGDELNEK